MTEELTLDSLIEQIDEVDTKNELLKSIKRELINKIREGYPLEILLDEINDLIKNVKEDKCPELDIYCQQQDIKKKYSSLQ